MLIPIVVLAVSLGRSFDMNSLTPSIFIYDPEDIEKTAKFIPKAFVKSQYRSVESSTDANNFLNINGDLSLKVKNGQFELKGVGEYLSESVNREKTIEILIEVYYETGTQTFPSYIPVRTDWQHKPESNVGTHYIRSIIYGGRLMVSLKYTAFRKEDMESIKAAVNANLQVSGSFDVSASGNLKKLTTEISDKAQISIQAFATAGIFNVPTTLEAAFKLVKDYPEMMKVNTTNNRGYPMMLEIVPLSTLQQNYTEYLKSTALDGILNSATDKYDDLRASMAEFTTWITVVDVEPKDEKMVGDYEKKMKLANRAMTKAIADLDPTKGPDQFKEAFKAYGEGPENLPNKYSREFLRIKHAVKNETFLWFPYTKAVSSYIRWGNSTCSLPSTEPLYIGYAATTNSFGNGADLQCLPSVEPSLDAKKITEKVLLSHIDGVGYKFPEKTGQIFCAYCVLQNATTTFVVTGRTECPSESKLEYEGYLVLNHLSGTVSSPICLDKNPVEEEPFEDKPKEDKSMATMVPAWVECPDCPEFKKKFLPCTVCSR